MHFAGKTYNNMMKSCVLKKMTSDEAAVKAWLPADILKLKKDNQSTKAKKSKRSTRFEAVRAQEPVTVVLYHIIEALTKRALEAYFKGINADMDDLSRRQVLPCLTHNAHTESEHGHRAMCDAMVSMFAILGGLDPVAQAQLVFNGRVVRASFGSYELASCFLLCYLESVEACNVNEPRTGGSLGWVMRWRAKVIRVDRIL